MSTLITLFLCISSINLAKDNQYELSLQIMPSSIPSSLHHQFYFYRAVSEFQTLQKDKFLVSAENFFNSFEAPPRRYQLLMLAMVNDAQNWQERGSIADISRRMGEVGRRLENFQSGKITQEKQKSIIEDLDKLINEKEKAGNSGQAQEDSSSKKKGSDQKAEGNGLTPATESVIMGSRGQAKVDEKELRQIAEKWGSLPPLERMRVIDEIKRDLPPKYQATIEEYFKALNKIYK
jgi:hypothetical protein